MFGVLKTSAPSDSVATRQEPTSAPTASSNSTRTTLSSSASRPYRSHKVAACDRCRKRKAVCKIKTLGQSCSFCEEKQLPCIFSDRKRCATKQPGIELNNTVPSSVHGSGNTWHGTSPNESSLIIGPAVAEDIQILEDYLSSRKQPGRDPSHAYRTVSATPRNPIVYMAVPRRRPGLQMAKDPGRDQLEVTEQILGPLQEELLVVFFDCIHPYLPILDENSFHDLKSRSDEPLSPALLCGIFTLSLTWWAKSETLRQHPRPSIPYACNQALAALQTDFMAPSMATICAALLAVSARPTKSVVSNITMIGQTVALAHSLDLNRNPSSWALSAEEKALRIRLWWGVVIHDHWSSYAHGTPPHIEHDRFDVPIPQSTAFAVLRPDSGTRGGGLHSFRQLCLLSRILGQVLPLVYTIDVDLSAATLTLRKAESALDDWETNVKYFFGINPESEPPSGHCSLWLAYLALRMLVQRLFLRLTKMQHGQSNDEAEKSRLSMLQEAAISIDFVDSLQEKHFQEFWIPYSSHFLVMTGTMLLRCMIELWHPDAKRQCRHKLVSFRAALQNATKRWDWDVADICLERCGPAISKIADSLGPVDGTPNEGRGAASAIGNGTSTQPARPEPELVDMDFNLPAGSLDLPWELLWDSIEGDLGTTPAI